MDSGMYVCIYIYVYIYIYIFVWNQAVLRMIGLALTTLDDMDSGVYACLHAEIFESLVGGPEKVDEVQDMHVYVYIHTYKHAHTSTHVHTHRDI